MAKTRFNIYASSAGSGKTFTLAKEYLKLALADDTTKQRFNPFYFKHILAVTFTNDAAKEMKHRVLEYLELFSRYSVLHTESHSRQSKAQTMRAVMLADYTTPPEWLLNEQILEYRASMVFQKILHEYSDFSIGTIDAFVQRIVRAFTEELQLPFNFEVNLETTVLLDAAVEKLLAKIGDTDWKNLSETVLIFVEDQTSEGKNWNSLRRELVSFAELLAKEESHEPLKQLESWDVNDFLILKKQLHQAIKVIENQCFALGRNAMNWIDGQGLSIEDFSNKKNGVAGFFESLAGGSMEKLLKETGSNVQNAYQNNQWYAKTSKDIQAKELIDGIADELHTILSKLLVIKESEVPVLKLFKEIRKNVVQIGLLKQLKAEIDEIQAETGNIHISDFNRRIMSIVLEEPIPFIYEKLGEKYHHILIDEFQDTSSLQWTNFMPLIENSLSSGFFNLVVGDSKQAIYRWRGGEMQQIVALHQQKIERLLPDFDEFGMITERYSSIARYISPQYLNTNRRSRKEVVAFNNDFFEFIKKNYSAKFPILAEVYDEYFRQQSPIDAPTGGHIQLSYCAEKDAEQRDIVHLSKILATVREAESDGFSAGDIAILTRNNKHGQMVAQFLKENGYDILSQDSLTLQHSGAASVIMAFFKLLNQPYSRLVRYELLQLLQKNVWLAIKLLTDEEKNIIEIADVAIFFEWILAETYQFQPKLKDQRLKLSQVQQADMYEKALLITDALGLFHNKTEQEYIFRLLDIIQEFMQKESHHLSDWLDFWQRKRSKLSIETPPSNKAITVTSIHKSKGLEFPVVLLPFASWEIIPRSTKDQFWANISQVNRSELQILSNEGEKKMPFVRVNMTKNIEESPLNEQYIAEEEKIFIDNINLLYVALTRAVDRIYVLIPYKKTLKNTVGGLFQAFAESKGYDFGETQDYILNQGLVQSKETVVAEKTEIETIKVGEFVYKNPAERFRLRRKFEQETDDARTWGNKIHETLAKIVDRRDIDNAVQESLRIGIIAITEVEALKKSIEKLLERPGISELFDGKLRTENERDILLPNGTTQRPDRVVWKDDIVHIIDYKTGFKKPEHQRQVEGYAHFYKQMGYEKIKTYIVYLE